MSKRRRTKRPKSDYLLPPLPPCQGPKLDAFPNHRSAIEWLERLDQADQQQSSQQGGEGFVYKVKIEGQLYALKVFKFFNPEDTQFYWGPILDEIPNPIETVACHTDPFFAECRAYGKIKESRDAGHLKRQPEIPCYGYLLLRGKDREKLQRDGIDLEEDCLDEDREPWEPESTEIPRPIRAIVKKLASNDSGVTKSKLRTIVADIKALNRLGIYNMDIREDNFKDGKLVDFGSARTEPHCYLHSADKKEATETRGGDLVMFDDMVSVTGILTKVRASPRRPNASYKTKLRSSVNKGSGSSFVSL